MMRFITAPFVGAFVGALEGGIVFAILVIFDVERGRPSGWDDPWLPLITLYGTIFGGFVGFVIGLLVALRNAGGRDGLLIGAGIGVVCSIYLLMKVGLGHYGYVALEVIVLPAAASMGFLSAVLTAGRKERESSAEPYRSRRIIT